MSFSYNVINTKIQRIALVSFRRAERFPPKLNHPDIDDRGYFRKEIASLNPSQPDADLGFDRGPIVGVTEGDKVFVELKRERIANKALLFVTSSDPSVMQVSTPEIMVSPGKYKSSDQLSPYDTQKLQITGLTGGDGVLPKPAKVEIRYGSSQGAIIGELTVYVFKLFYLNIVPHIVTLSGSKGYGVSYIFDAGKILELVQAIWQPCGIKFLVGSPEPEFFQSNMNEAGKWKYSDSDKMFNSAKRHHTDAVNIYFVSEIVSDHGVIAYARKPGGGKSKRGVIAHTNELESDISFTINDLAITIGHELGHHFNLDHTDKNTAKDQRDDLWSKDRLLMRPTGGFLDENCLVTMKDLYDINNLGKNHITDPEWLTVRTSINSKEAYR